MFLNNLILNSIFFFQIRLDFIYLHPGKDFINKWMQLQDQTLEILKKDVTQEGIKNKLINIHELTFNQSMVVMLLKTKFK